MLLVDGGGAGHRSPPASPPAPPPPPPQRVTEAPVPPSQGSGSAAPHTVEQQREPLAAAAQNTQQKVTLAAQANNNVAQLENLPPQTRRQLEPEIKSARADAGRAKANAHKAVHDELEVAKQVLSPAYYEDYSNQMDRDFSANADEAAVVREAKAAATNPAKAKAAAADASLAEIESKQAEVEQAETRYNDAARSVEGAPPHIREFVTQPLYAAREAKRTELAALIETDLSAAAKLSPRHPYDDRLAARALQIADLAPGNANLKALVDNSKQHVTDTRVTDAAVTSIENTYKTKGAVAAAEELGAQTAWMTPSQAAMLNDRASGTIDKIAADIGKSTKQDDVNKAVKGLSAAAEKGGATSAAQIAESLAKGFSDDGVTVAHPTAKGAYSTKDYKLDDALKAAVAGGSGAALAVATAGELRSAGRVDAANRIDQAVVGGVDKLRENNAAIQKAYGQRDIQLQKDLANFGPGMTDKQRADYVKAYWADGSTIPAADADDLPSNAEIKRQAEAADDKLSSALATATPTLERLARGGDENAGEVMLDAYEALARSPEHAEESIKWMQSVKGDGELFAKLDGYVDNDLNTRFSDGISADGLNSMTSKLLADLANAKDESAATKLFNGFVETTKTLSKDKGYVDNIKAMIEIRGSVDKLKDLKRFPVGSEERIKLENDIGTRSENLLKGWSSKDKLSKALAVAGIVVGLSDANKAFKDGKVYEGIKAAIGTGKAAAELSIGILGVAKNAGKVSESFAEGVAKVGGSVLPVIGLGLDIAQGVDDVKQLMHEPNAGEVIAGVGTLFTLAGDAAKFVPLAGTLVGGVLGAVGSLLHGVGGIVDKLIEGGEAEKALHARQEGYLKSAGLSETVAKNFVDAPAQISLLENFDLKPEQVQSLVTQLASADADRHRVFIALSETAAAHGLKGDAAARLIGEAFTASDIEEASDYAAIGPHGFSRQGYSFDDSVDYDTQQVRAETSAWLREYMPDVYQRHLYSPYPSFSDFNSGYFDDYNQLLTTPGDDIAGKN
jgi:hypothetical protein